MAGGKKEGQPWNGACCAKCGTICSCEDKVRIVAIAFKKDDRASCRSKEYNERSTTLCSDCYEQYNTILDAFLKCK